MFKNTIRRKLILGIVLPLLFVYGTVAVLQIRNELDTALRHIKVLLQNDINDDAAECDIVFWSAAEAAQGVANYISAEQPDSEKNIEHYLRKCLETHPHVAGTVVAYKSGIFPGQKGRFSPYLYRDAKTQELVYQNTAPQYDYENGKFDWYSVPEKTLTPYWSEPYFDEDGGKMLMCTYAVPFLQDGKFAGVATVDIALDQIRQIIVSAATGSEISSRTEHYLFSTKGTVISASDSSLEMKETVFTIAKFRRIPELEKAGNDMLNGKSGEVSYFNPQGMKERLIYSPLKSTGWFLSVSLQEAAVVQPIYFQFFVKAGVSLLGLFVIVGIITFVSFKITLPLKKLSSFANQIAQGNLDAYVHNTAGTDEINHLAEVFNKMVASLRESIDEVVKTRTEAAEAAYRTKTKFLTLASHELRTPIHGIMSAVELLLETPLNNKQHEYVDIQQESAVILQILISNILDYSKLDAGGITVQHTVFRLRELIEQIRPVLLFQAANRNVNINIQFDDRIQDRVEGDVVRLRQVLLNLLTNAVKFSARPDRTGNVTLNVKPNPASESNKIRFEVIDDGVGISEEKQKKLFGTWQYNASDNRQYDGFGLGLTISKSIVDTLNGEIGMFSEEGKGASFWIEIPLPCTDAEESGVSWVLPAGSTKKVLKILVAEDNKINQMVMKEMLKNLGYETAIAENGRKAVEAWESDNFDAVIMDCQMPEMDGYEATRLIRQKEKELSKKPIPVIALTANVSPGDRERCLAAGMNDYFNKPVKPRELAMAIQSLIARYACNI